jgi:GT2 family glycosyltransferase
LILTEDKLNIIIVDNNSDIKDLIKMEKEFEYSNSVKIIRNKTNLGYFKGLNVGIANVSKKKKDVLIVIGNNDILFKKDFLVELSITNYSKDTFVLAPNIITLDGYHQNPQVVIKQSELKKILLKLYFTNYYIGKILTYIALGRMKITKYQDNLNWNREMFIRQGNGACYILTENFFGPYNKLDDRVFLWGEEALLASQVFSANGKILYKPSIVVYHQKKLKNTLLKQNMSKEEHRIMERSYRIYSKYL